MSEIVSLAERLRYMQMFRLAVASLVAFFGVLAPELLGVGMRELLAGTGAYLLVSIASEGAWRLSRRRGLTLFGAMLITDGVYLAWLAYATGGAASPLRYLIVVHVVAVALLASFRTGLKLALWHSLLLLVVFHGQEAGILQGPGPAALALPGSEQQQLLAFAGVLWLVALVTASFSAINERELRRRRFDLEALASLATDLEGASGSLSVAEVIVDNVTDAFGFERAVLVSANDEHVSLMAARGCERPPAPRFAPPPGSVIRRALEARQTLLVSQLDPEGDSWLLGLFPSGRNFVVVPLSAEGSEIAVLVVEHAMRPGSRIQRRVVSMLERFASHGALALRNAELLEQLEKAAATDGLTGIANRRTFEATLEREMSRARRTGEDLSVILLDIDHFKRLNDTHGHQAGDDVLREIAGLLARHCRDFDTPARYGGEEFAVILPSSSPSDALVVAERFRRVIAEADTAVPVTASIGAATWRVDAEDAASLLRAADEALYESKRSGRNRVTGSTSRLAEPIPPDPVTAP